jgi:hypothetical protein
MVEVTGWSSFVRAREGEALPACCQARGRPWRAALESSVSREVARRRGGGAGQAPARGSREEGRGEGVAACRPKEEERWGGKERGKRKGEKRKRKGEKEEKKEIGK